MTHDEKAPGRGAGQGGTRRSRKYQAENAGKGILGQENNLCKERLKEESLGWVCLDWEIPHLGSRGEVWNMASPVLEDSVSLSLQCGRHGARKQRAPEKRRALRGG